MNPLRRFFSRITCSYHGHYWVNGVVVMYDGVAHVGQYCARQCGATRHRTYDTSTPYPPTTPNP